MQHTKYFVQGQKVRLKVSHHESEMVRFEALTGFVEDCRPGRLDLALPYQVQEGEAYPFSPDMPLEVLTEAFGMGLRLSASFVERLSDRIIHLKLSQDLQAFQHRLKQRTDCSVGLRLTKGQGTLRTLRERWRKNVELLHSGRDLSSLKTSPQCEANLSSGGIRVVLTQPVTLADVFLLLIDLRDGGPPVCALAETVWSSEEMAEKGQAVGMQFIAILEADQSRIDKFVKQKQPKPETRANS